MRFKIKELPDNSISINDVNIPLNDTEFNRNIGYRLVSIRTYLQELRLEEDKVGDSHMHPQSASIAINTELLSINDIFPFVLVNNENLIDFLTLEDDYLEFDSKCDQILQKLLEEI